MVVVVDVAAVSDAARLHSKASGPQLPDEIRFYLRLAHVHAARPRTPSAAFSCLPTFSFSLTRTPTLSVPCLFWRQVHAPFPLPRLFPTDQFLLTARVIPGHEEAGPVA